MDDRREDALTCFSGWWRSWPLLAYRVRSDSREPKANLDESADFAIWAAELAAPGEGFRQAD